MRAGGWWRCAVNKRELSRRTDEARRDMKAERQRDRYDTDPIYRIEKNLRVAAYKRRVRLERRRADLASDYGGQ